MVARRKSCLCITGEEIVGSVDEMDSMPFKFAYDGKKGNQNKINM